ncbi:MULTISPECIES: hypothetical protein [unclassified Streptomyces]
MGTVDSLADPAHLSPHRPRSAALPACLHARSPAGRLLDAGPA